MAEGPGNPGARARVRSRRMPLRISKRYRAFVGDSKLRCPPVGSCEQSDLDGPKNGLLSSLFLYVT